MERNGECLGFNAWRRDLEGNVRRDEANVGSGNRLTDE